MAETSKNEPIKTTIAQLDDLFKNNPKKNRKNETSDSTHVSQLSP